MKDHTDTPQHRTPKTIFELSRSGRRAWSLPDVEGNGYELPTEFRRKDAPKLPEVDEPTLVRHFTQISERNFAIGILTNVQNGWRLIQQVEREALRSYHGIVYAKNQAIAHRGLVETLPNVEPLATQPDLTQYVGRYQRPMNAVDVRVENGTLLVQELPNSGGARNPLPIAFFGPDRAVITGGDDRGQSIEFIRDAAGAVKWVRVVGRVAVRTP